MVEVLVLGGGFGGVTAALEAAANGKQVELLDRKGYHEYTPGLIDRYRDRVKEEKLRRSLNGIFENTGVNFSREIVESIDPDSKTVVTNAGERNYQKLVVALGSQPASFGNDISELEDPYTLEGVRETMKDLYEAESAAVVGSGYVGVEVAAELQERGLDVTVFDGSSRPMPNSSEAASEILIDYFNSKNIVFRAGKRVEDVDGETLTLNDGTQEDFDKVFWNAGIKAASLVQNEFDTERAGISVNSNLKARNYLGVYALGDAADAGSLKTAHNAMRQAEVVGANVAGGNVEWKEKDYPLLVSLGKTGMMTYKGKALRNFSMRHMKDMVRRYYWNSVSRKRLKARLLG